MSRRVVLWIAFAVVHVGVAWLGWILPNAPMGDVYLVYEPWSRAYFSGGWVFQADYSLYSKDTYVGFVGLDKPWVYPQLAILPMLATWIFGWLVSYTPAWAIMIILLDAAAFAMLVGRARSRGRVTAAWFWLAFIVLLGPIALYRIDAVTVALGIMGVLWLRGRPWAASVLLAVATWMKVWPAALLAAAVIAVRRRMAIIGGGLAVTAVTLGAVVLLGGGAHAFNFIMDQTSRSLQVESPVSTFYLWDDRINGTSSVHYDPDLLTFYITGPHVDTVIAVMTPLLVVGVLAVAALGGYKAWRRASFSALFPPLALALVTAFIALNKVGSPQYIVWISVPLIMGLVLDRARWRGPAIVALVVAITTQIVYPLTYFDLLVVMPVPLVSITIRNALMVTLFVWSVVLLARVRTRAPRAATSFRSDSALAGGS
ncbi:glycosyltransferase 87 family protein [Microbacterium sp. SORGH_AS_0888]|uniref:glycosyltransferase 87 family protein n=1 Tax=Microbacterium sp. SORGH_AS_0888 TaxID=3041791 RepID=UPI0027849328|nr:glycosyltransferase 87 family protein [Microbacterium sp. SORGH_AS_0888]MDQ1127958.1 hypothetical protein [Microbacterium sp. SORGH_AS_0888]